MNSLAYYESERFIHDDLVQKAQATVDTIYELWKNKNKKLDSLLLTWPAEPIEDSAGITFEGVCGMELPEAPAAKSKAIRDLVRRTKAYAFFVADYIKDQNRLKCILETPHGTRVWTIPIYRSGDVDVLGEAKVADDTECLGLIWQKNKGLA